MKILIIGGCGYIGSKLTNYLIDHNCLVSTVDLEWFGKTNSNNWKLDYNNLSKEYLSNFNIVILLAGHSSVPMCIDNTISTFNNNVGNFIKLVSKLTNQRFIYASSASVYGNTIDETANESFLKFVPMNAYDISKWEIDLYSKISNLDYYALRLGTVNGHSPNLRMDLMINKMVYDALNTNKLSVNNRPAYRPLLGIHDLCRAVYTIIMSKDRLPGYYNLASFNTQIGKVATKVVEVIPNVTLEVLPDSVTYNMSMSTDKFQQVYNFTFEDTIESIIQNLVSNYNKGLKGTRQEKIEYV